MKSILVIGIGRFGHHLTEKLVKLGNEVMIVDKHEENLKDLVSIATSAKIGDCTDIEVLKSLGVSNFDVVFVCIGTDFQSSLEITSQVKELGASWVISKATRDIHAKFLLRNGADEVAYPEKYGAETMATRVSAEHVFDYIELSEEFGIYEIPIIDEWNGRTIKDINFRAKYNINIVGTKKKADGAMSIVVSPEHVLSSKEHLMILGEKDTVDKLLKKLK